MDTKVLLISDTVYDANGVSRFIQDMAEQARRSGAGFAVLSSSPLVGEGPEVNITNIPPFWYIRMPFYKEQFLTLVPPWLKMYRFVRKHRPGIIHISTPGPLGVCAMAIAKYCGIPIVGTYHTDFPSYIRRQTNSGGAEYATKRFMRFFFHRMHKVFLRSPSYLAVLENDLYLRRDKLEIIPQGTDTEKFSPKYRNETVWTRFDVRSDTVKLLYVGRLSVEKNFLFVITLFEKLQAVCGVPLSLIVVGEGALAETVSRKRNSRIHLLGLQGGETLSQLYASSDLMLFGSVTETLGQVVMEAQASGLPCAVSDQGGVTDIVISGSTGFCIPIGDEAQWLEKTRMLIENPALRKQMGDSACAMMQNRSIATTFRRFLQVHDEIVNVKRSGKPGKAG